MRAPRLKPTEDKRAVLTSITVDGDTGADGAALADAVNQHAVGDTLVIFAHTVWKRHAAMSADAPEGEAGRRLQRRARTFPSKPQDRLRPFFAAGHPKPWGEPSGERDATDRAPPHPQRGRRFVALPGAGRSGAPTAPVRGGGSAGNERGRPQGARRGARGRHSPFWAQAAAQSSSRSAAPRSGSMASAGGGARRGRGKSLGGAGLGRERERECCVRGGERCEPPDRFGRGWPRRALLAPVTPERRRGRQRHLLPGQPGVVKPPPPPTPGRNWMEQGEPELSALPFPAPAQI